MRVWLEATKKTTTVIPKMYLSWLLAMLLPRLYTNWIINPSNLTSIFELRDGLAEDTLVFIVIILPLILLTTWIKPENGKTGATTAYLIAYSIGVIGAITNSLFLIVYKTPLTISNINLFPSCLENSLTPLLFIEKSVGLLILILLTCILPLWVILTEKNTKKSYDLKMDACMVILGLIIGSHEYHKDKKVDSPKVSTNWIVYAFRDAQLKRNSRLSNVLKKDKKDELKITEKEKKERKLEKAYANYLKIGQLKTNTGDSNK